MNMRARHWVSARYAAILCGLAGLGACAFLGEAHSQDAEKARDTKEAASNRERWERGQFEAEGLRLSAELIADTAMSGHAIELVVRIKNTGQQPVRYLRRHAADFLEYEVIGPQSTHVATLARYRRLTADSSFMSGALFAARILPPGTEHRHYVVLNSLFDLSDVGAYQVRVRLPRAEVAEGARAYAVRDLTTPALRFRVVMPVPPWKREATKSPRKAR